MLVLVSRDFKLINGRAGVMKLSRSFESELLNSYFIKRWFCKISGTPLIVWLENGSTSYVP
jgi:hypothetical protein